MNYKRITCVLLFCAVILLLKIQVGSAYQNYNEGCHTCHGNGGDAALHPIHTGQTCTACHTGSGGSVPVQSVTCIGCHPRTGTGQCPLCVLPSHTVAHCLNCHPSCSPISTTTTTISTSTTPTSTITSTITTTINANTTREVGVGKFYDTIQAAINASSNGDTVLVYPGTYAENIIFNGRAITVKSVRGSGVPIINGSAAGSVVSFVNGERSSSVLDGFIITNGSSYVSGGIHCEYYSSPTIKNCIITGNTATNGGGIGCVDSEPAITNCTITGNSATNGGGIYSEYSGAFLLNTILWGNTATNVGNEIYLDSNSGISVSYSDVMGGYEGTGNINADPLFVGGGNYHLQTGSPCINAGNSVGAPATDIEGTARPQGSGYDMGAYEYVAPITTTTVVTTSTIITTSSTSTSSTTTTAIPITLEVGAGKPYGTIQSAINAASNGDTVLVYTGIDYYYSESINFLGKAILVKAVNEPGWRQKIHPNAYSYPYYTVTFENGEGPGSVLDGFDISSLGRGIYCIGSSPTITNCIITGDNGYTFDSIGIYCSNASPTITNCTIRNNKWYGPNSGHGGIYCENSSSPTIDNCTITSNEKSGIYCVNSSPLIKNCTITKNNATYGGGISSQGYVHPTITDCTITGNSAGYGGGIDSLTRFGDDPPVITNCTITGNTASSFGGGIAIRHAVLDMRVPFYTHITNCSITGNKSQYGGGMYFSETTHPKITNCTIAGNKATASGGGICSYSLWGPRLTNSILWGNDAPNDKEIYGSFYVTYSDVDGGWTGMGNIAIDPQFVMPGYWNNNSWIPGDYHLQAVSPCIDSGTSDGAPATDIAGTPRPQGAGFDMGAYEFSTDSDNDGLFDWQDNCPAVCNPQQLDADNDGLGDVCDTAPGCGTGCGQVQCEPECPPPSTTSTTTSIPDTDSDGFLDNVDNCPTICNPQQLDADTDGIGDVCDDPNNDGCGGCGQPGCEAPC